MPGPGYGQPYGEYYRREDERPNAPYPEPDYRPPGQPYRQQPQPRPRAAPKIPHTGSWSSWENGKPVGGNEKFEDLPGCYTGMANLALKFNYEVHLTCENDKGAVVLYQVCKPADGVPECYSKMTPPRF